MVCVLDTASLTWKIMTMMILELSWVRVRVEVLVRSLRRQGHMWWDLGVF